MNPEKLQHHPFYLICYNAAAVRIPSDLIIDLFTQINPREQAPSKNCVLEPVSESSKNMDPEPRPFLFWLEESNLDRFQGIVEKYFKSLQSLDRIVILIVENVQSLNQNDISTTLKAKSTGHGNWLRICIINLWIKSSWWAQYHSLCVALPDWFYQAWIGSRGKLHPLQFKGVVAGIYRLIFQIKEARLYWKVKLK